MKQLFIYSTGFIFLFISCKLSENIQDGQTAFNLKKYALASELLQKDFNKEGLPEQKAKLAFEIAQSYQFNNQIAEAAKWYKTAIEWEYGSDAILDYARMLKEQEKYQEAIIQFNEYLKQEPYRRPEITTEINACNNALAWIQKQNDEYEQDIFVSNLKDLNSPEADFNPVLYKDNTILFTSSRNSATGDEKDKWTTNKYYDLYSAGMTGFTRFSAPVLFEGPVNSEYNDGAVTFSKDLNEMFFTRCGSENKKINDYCNLYYSNYEPDAGWSEPVVLPFFEDSLNIGTSCLSPDGQTLFFAAVQQDGYGGSDIFMSKKSAEGWDAPVNAGTTINTPGNEIFPSFGPDGTFYFASDGHPGMGGLDIFSAKIIKGKFTQVHNMEYPVNSGADDFGILVLDNTLIKNPDTLQIGYFSSARAGGVGGDDIYMFVKKTKKLHPAVLVLNGKIVQKVYEDPKDPSSKVLDTIPLPASTAIVTYVDGATALGKFSNGEGGNFSMQIDSMKEYKITGMKDAYFTNSTILSTMTVKGKPGDTVILYAEIVLDKIPESATTEIKLNNIYYDYDKTTLRPESFPELDKLVKLLEENPSVTIKINANTDSRGKDAYNLKLSEGRAKSVVDYLIAKGIDAQRLVSKGNGESLPEVLNADEKLPDGNIIPKGTVLTEAFINKYKSSKDNFEFLHQLNRRTSFNVLSSTFNIQSGAPDEIKTDQAPDNR